MSLFRSILYPAVVTVLAVATFAPAAALRAQTDSTVKTDSTARTVISQDQAVRGMTVFIKTCVECHTKTDVSGPDFKLKWNTRPVYDLFDIIRTTMPDDKPGGMTQDEYMDVTAYLLRINGAPAGGTALAPTDTAGLKKWRMDIVVPSPNLDSVKVDTTRKYTSRTSGSHGSSTAARIGVNHLFSRQLTKN